MGVAAIGVKWKGSSEKVYYAHPGDWTGEIALIWKSPGTAPVLVIEPTELAIKPSAVIRVTPDLINSLPETSQLKIYRQLSVLAAEQIWELNEILMKAKRRIDSDLEIAARFLQSLLPPPINEGGPVRTDWRFVPCMHLGGDAFGYGWLDAKPFPILPPGRMRPRRQGRFDGLQHPKRVPQ